MKGTLTSVMFAGLMVLGASASAQEEEAPMESRHYDFNDMLIDGEFQRPSGMFATERGQARFDALLSLRRSFIDEIEEAAHEGALD